MFWRRRRTDDFEWHRHVRTTIKLRRDERRKRIDEAKNVAAAEFEKIQKASVDGARKSADALGSAAGRGGRALGARAKSTARGALALASASLHWLGRQLNRELRGSTWQTRLQPAAPLGRAIAAVPWPRKHWGAALAGIGIVTICALLISNGRAPWTSLFAATRSVQAPSFFAPPAKPITGRARALSGDTMIVDGKRIVLTGIDAPELIQRCRRRPSSRRTYGCGIAARDALRRITGRSVVTCDAASPDAAGRTRTRCRIGENDLAEQLASDGYVFPDGGSYAAAFQAARAAKKGVWRAQNTAPTDVRNAAWARAAKAAPKGCPIKGRGRRGQSTYMMPHDPLYRRARVYERRGDRWFCSENEAIAAGFKLSLGS